MLDMHEVAGSNPAVSTKKFRESCSRNFFIQAAGLAYHRRAKCGVYHQPLWGCISSRVSVYLTCDLMRCKAFRFDDIPQQVADDIHAFGVIGMRIILNLLHSALNCAIIKPERRWRYEKGDCWHFNSKFVICILWL